MSDGLDDETLAEVRAWPDKIAEEIANEPLDPTYRYVADNSTLVEDALNTAHAFMESVTAWTGHEDDLAEALGAVDEALASLADEDAKADEDSVSLLRMAARRGVDLAERYGEAIAKISAALDGTPGGINRARAIIAGLATEKDTTP